MFGHADVIEESDGAWSSRIVMVKKKNGKMRMCIDFRQLNEMTVKNAYPAPQTKETLNQLAGNVYFTSFDAQSGYWQCPIEEKS